MSDELNSHRKTKPPIGKLIGAVLVAVALIAFVVQNTDSTPVQWLFIDRSAPLWLIIVISAVAGAVLSEILSWLVRRRR